MEINIYPFKKSSSLISVFSLMSVLQEVASYFITAAFSKSVQSESYDIDLFCQLDLHG